MHWAYASADATAPAFARGQAVVGLAPGADPRALGLRVLRTDAHLRLAVVAGAPPALAALAARHDPRVRYVEPVRTAAPAHVRNDPFTWQIDARTGAPYEWAFHTVGVDQALSLTKGDPSILVGIVDSGVTSVADLRGKIAETFWDPKTSVSALDSVGHGTYVSSIVAARNDDGFGLAGFCGACRVAVYKAVPLTDVEVAAGIEKLTDARVRVINLSLVLSNASPAIADAINYATAAGVLVVGAAGNEGIGNIDFPASYLQQANGVAGPGLAVGASNASGNAATFSNWGNQLSLLAPGTFDGRCTSGVIGALPGLTGDFDTGQTCDSVFTTVGGHRYAYSSGTSFASPEVAGIAALIWAAAPTLTNTQVANVLEQTATRPAGVGWTPAAGWGVVNAKAAVASALGRSSIDTLALSGLHIIGARRPGDRVRASVRASWSDQMPVVAGAQPTCTVTAGGKPVRTNTSLATGVVTCAYTLPAKSAGERVAGNVSLASAGAPTVSASFAFTVR
jgi:hypothetical protein